MKERNGGYWYEIISISHVNVIRESRAKSMQAARVTKPEIGDGNSILFNLVSSPCCPPFFLADDKAPSVTGCPDPIKVNLPQGNNSEVVVTWTEPSTSETVGVSQTETHQPGYGFTIGVTAVQYTFTDQAGNSAFCTFNVTVSGE